MAKIIQAAGGILVRGRLRPLFAIVQRSKDDSWVLPRGKLKRHERPIVAARREVIEETGHLVRVREFLGAITYRASGKPKVVQFWRMYPVAGPSRDVASDIAAIEWLPLAAAIKRLSYPLEQEFLRTIGRRVISRRKNSSRRRPARTKRRPRAKR